MPACSQTDPPKAVPIGFKAPRLRAFGGLRAALHVQWALGATLLLLSAPGGVRAHDDLIEQLPRGSRYTDGFDGGAPRAAVRDGFLHGHGRESHRLLADGRLQVDRIKVYTRVAHPETHRLVPLPDKWTVRQRIVLSPELRLVSSDTRLDFHRSIDRALTDYRFSEEHPRYFEWDHSRIRAVAGGAKLRHVRTRGGQPVDDETYDYPPNALPIEVVGIALSAAILNRLRSFEYDILLPGGSTHGIKVDVRRTDDLTGYAKGYGLPKRFQDHLKPGQDLLVMDMRLSSPVKKLVFPHHFYIAYLRDRPQEVIAFWGGKPGEHVYAFRTDDWRVSRGASGATGASGSTAQR